VIYNFTGLFSRTSIRPGGGSINSRTTVSLARTVFYGACVLGLFFFDANASPLMSAAIVAAILADYVTWMTRTILLLPADLLHGCYDGVINISFAAFLFKKSSFDTHYDADALAIACFTFLLVAFAKVFAYGMQLAVSDD
jgi:hypothetical protein